VDLLLRTPAGLLARVFPGEASGTHIVLSSGDGMTWSQLSAPIADLPALETRTTCTASLCLMLGPANAQPVPSGGAATPSAFADPDATTAMLSSDGKAWQTVPIHGSPPTVLITPSRGGATPGYVLTRMVVLDDRIYAVGTNGRGGVVWPLTITP